MQPIGDYLKKLLYQYDCLVVPGLGAFLTHGVSASYNERDGLFLPPRRRLAFNEAMRLDDGILTNYLMFHEQCNREAALAHIDAFVQEIRQSAQQMGSYTINGIGLFSLNAENSLQFDPELRHNFLSSAYGLSPVRVQSASVLLAQPVTESGSVATRIPLFVVATDQVNDDVTIMEMPLRQLSPAWRWAAVAFLAGSLGFISYFTFLHPNQGLQSSLNPASMFRMFAPASLSPWSRNEVGHDMKTPVTPVAKPVISTEPAPPTALVEEEPGVMLPTLAPIKTTPVPVAVKKVVVPAVVKPQPVADLPAESSSAVKETAVPPAPKAVQVSKPIAILPFAGSPYAIVVGSFANRGNALRLRKRLIAAGYTDAAILPVRRGELIRVAAMGAASLNEAAISKDSLTRFTGANALIVRNR